MGDRGLLVGRLHLGLTILLAGTLITLGLLVAAGQLEIRPAGQAQGSGKQGGGQVPSAGPRVQRVEADEFFSIVGHKAYCFKYEGTWIDCWIEIDVDGKKTRLGEGLGSDLQAAARAAADGRLVGGEPSGHLVWVRRPEKEKEVWDLAVSLLGKDGKAIACSKLIGFSPPPTAGARRYSDGPASGGSLSGERELTLATFVTFGEEGGKIARTATLKCKAMK